MATVIRLKRGGRTHDPYYRVVVMDSRTRMGGRIVDQIGVYQPCARPNPVIEIDMKKALAWLEKGAQPSDTARNILSDKGILKAFASGVRAADVQVPAPAEAASVSAPTQAEA